MLKNTRPNILVDTWVFETRNAPKPVFGRGSVADPSAGSLRVTTLPGPPWSAGAEA